MIQECLRDYLVQVIYGLDVAAAEGTRVSATVIIATGLP